MLSIFRGIAVGKRVETKSLSSLLRVNQSKKFHDSSYWLNLPWLEENLLKQYPYIPLYLLTCIGFHPGLVESASSRASIAYRCCSLKKIIWELIKGRVPSPTRKNALFAADFPQTHWQSDPRPPGAGTDTSWIFTRAPSAGLQPSYR